MNNSNMLLVLIPSYSACLPRTFYSLKLVNMQHSSASLTICSLVSRENMEKVNVRFHDNGTVSFQHHKILEFVPELSVDKNLRIVVPNIPLLVSTT